ncbi:MAG: WG repeat-containing protein, partial [Oscillospiraceae bacterium]
MKDNFDERLSGYLNEYNDEPFRFDSRGIAYRAKTEKISKTYKKKSRILLSVSSVALAVMLCVSGVTVYAAVSNNQYNIISKSDEYSADVFKDQDGKLGVVTKNKNVLINAEWDDIQIAAKDRFIVTLNGKVGLIDANGSMLIECIYDEITVIDNLLVAYVQENNGKYAAYSMNGSALSNKTWDYVKGIGENKFILEEGLTTYFVEAKGEEFKVTGVHNRHEEGTKAPDTHFAPEIGTKPENVNTGIHQSVVTATMDFMKAVFEKNNEKIKAITTEEFYNTKYGKMKIGG